MKLGVLPSLVSLYILGNMVQGTILSEPLIISPEGM
jgi:hypothetical protein